MDKIRICGVGAILILFFAFSANAADIAGQSDTTYRIDYVKSFFNRVSNYTSTPWRIDPDTSGIELAINDARLEVSNRFPDACQRRDTLVTDGSTLWFALNSDCREVVRVATSDPAKAGEVGLDPISINQIGLLTTVSDPEPKYYAVWGNPKRIYFDPNNQSGDTLFIYYLARANSMLGDTIIVGSDTLLGDSAICNISKQYFNLIVDMAIVKFYSARPTPTADRTIALAQKRIEEILASIEPEEVKPGTEMLR